MRIRLIKLITLVLSGNLLLSLPLSASVSLIPEFMTLGRRQLNRHSQLAPKTSAEQSDSLLKQLDTLEQTFKQCLASTPHDQQCCQTNYTEALIARYHCVPTFLLIKHAVYLRHLLAAQAAQPADPELRLAEQAAQQALATKITAWQAYDKAHAWWW